jgi:hypothetical protein
MDIGNPMLKKLQAKDLSQVLHNLLSAVRRGPQAEARLSKALHQVIIAITETTARHSCLR